MRAVTAQLDPLVHAPTTVVTTVAVTTASVLLVAANPNRKGWVIFNNSANSCYLTLGLTSVSSTCSYLLPTFTQWVWANHIIYTGPISVIRNSGSGGVTIHEIV